jgi:hypothetical protein
VQLLAQQIMCVKTLLCAAVGTASDVCEDTTVYSCRHSKCCVWRQYHVQLWAQQVLCVETLLCTAVGTASAVWRHYFMQL